MKKSFTQKHPYITVILFGLLCTFMTGLGAAVPQIIGLEENQQLIVTTVFLVASVLPWNFYYVKIEVSTCRLWISKYSKGK